MMDVNFFVVFSWKTEHPVTELCDIVYLEETMNHLIFQFSIRSSIPQCSCIHKPTSKVKNECIISLRHKCCWMLLQSEDTPNLCILLIAFIYLRCLGHLKTLIHIFCGLKRQCRK